MIYGLVLACLYCAVAMFVWRVEFDPYRNNSRDYWYRCIGVAIWWLPVFIFYLTKGMIMVIWILIRGFFLATVALLKTEFFK